MTVHRIVPYIVCIAAVGGEGEENKDFFSRFVCGVLLHAVRVACVNLLAVLLVDRPRCWPVVVVCAIVGFRG